MNRAGERISDPPVGVAGSCPVLLLACGNPSRGDDALGPLLIERMEALQHAGRLAQVDLLTDFQLQIEHVVDMRGRALVVFADAAATGPAPFSYQPVRPRPDARFSTHAMDPGAVLDVFERVMQGDAPPSYLLAIRGYRFDLGSPLTREADVNLARAVEHLVDVLGP